MISNSFCFSRSICYKYINNVSKNHIFAEKKSVFLNILNSSCPR